MFRIRESVVVILVAMVAVWGCSKGQAPAQPQKATAKDDSAKAPPGGLDASHRELAQKLTDNALRWLLAHREEDGGWSMGGGANKAAVTAMVLKALIQDPAYGPDSPDVKKGFEVLLKFRQKDGGIYEPRLGLANYTTAVSVMALSAAQNPQYRAIIDDAVKFMKGQQIVAGAESPDGQKIAEDHPFFGGVSYGEQGRPDLSNLGMWIDALHEAGVSPDDPAIRNALVFVTRTQNRSESNKSAWALEGGNDGGFVYAPALKGDLARGESKAGPDLGGRGLRSYGSMTYVGFKSLLYAGLTKQDPRVQAAYDWMRRYWRLDSNPNMPRLQSKQGLFYYYHAFAKALRAWGEPVITDPEGKQHNWRHELIDMLNNLVKEDGSWVNAADRWEEGSGVLVTTYGVLALQETLKN